MTSEKEKVFQKIYIENERSLRQFFVRQTGSEEDAEDLLHEIFIVLLFRLEEFIPTYASNPKQVKAFLFGIAYKKILHYWRKHLKILNMEISTELVPELADPKTLLDSGDFPLPDWLSEQDRKLLFLKVSGYSLREIADQLGVSYPACRMRSSRLAKDLKNFWEI